MAEIIGTTGADTIEGTADNDTITGLAGNDTINGNAGNDIIDAGDGDDLIDSTAVAGAGDDDVTGGLGNDQFGYFVGSSGLDRVNLGAGNDVVNVTAAAGTQVRLTFTSAEVGNGLANDSNTMANQDGGLAVRFQAEDSAGNLTGAVSRFDDEGITFSAAPNVTFEVRDLVSGVSRGSNFEEVFLGTSGADIFVADELERPYYVNAGMGDDNITGSNVGDFLVGGAGNDTINGLGGNDSSLAGGGNDTVNGGDGNDTIDGGDGDDLIDSTAAAGAGDDTITGGLGNDQFGYFVGSSGLDRVNLGAGNDLVNVSAAAGTQVRLTFTSTEIGNDVANDSNTMANQDGGLAVRFQAEDSAGNLTGVVSRFDDEGITFSAAPNVTFEVRDLVSGVSRGSNFEEVFLGTSGADIFVADELERPYYVNAGMGDDNITGSNVGDFLVGGAGNDTINGLGGNDSFLAGGGNDTVNGGDGNDTIDGGDGDDLLRGGAGADVLTGGNGIDTASYDDNLGAVFVNLNSGQGFGNAAQGDTFASIENVTGSSFNDTLIGNGSVNVLRGNAGNDTLIGGLGGDTLEGGLGIDTASYEDNQGSVFVNLDTGRGFNNAAEGDTYSGIENLTGTAFADFLIGNGDVNVLNGGAGNDILIGGLAGDTLIGGAGIDTASYEDNQGSVFVNLDIGRGFNNAAEGDIYSGIENIVGGAFADFFIGDSGANVLNGRGGSDTLIGAGGADVFAFDTALGSSNIDTIKDFLAGTDKIQLDDSIFTALSQGTLSANAFTTGTAATTADQRIIYNQNTGALSYDADGSGSGVAIQFATVSTNLNLAGSDFVVI